MTTPSKKPRKFFRFEPHRRRLAILAALAIMGVAEARLDSESMTLTTYYPSPVGNYLNMQANKVVFNKAYSNTSSAAGNCVYNSPDNPIGAPCLAAGQTVPPAGEVFYNGDTDQLFMASNQADPTDQSTWFKPVSGMTVKQVGSMTLDSFIETQTWYWAYNKTWWASQWTRGWAAGPEYGIKTITTSPWYLVNFALRIPKQTSSGLYSVDASGVYCTSYTVTLQGDVAAGQTPEAHPMFTLYRGQYGYWWSALAQVVAAIPLTTVNGDYICGNYEVESMFMLNRGNYQDYGLQFRPDIYSDDCAYKYDWHPCSASGPSYEYGWKYGVCSKPPGPGCPGTCKFYPRTCYLDKITGSSLKVTRLLGF